MNKKLILITVLVLVLGLVITYVVFNSDNKVETEGSHQAAVENDQINQNLATKGRGSLQDIFDWGQNLECAVFFKTEGLSTTTVNGTYFTSQKRVRGDFMSEVDGGRTMSSFIMNDDSMYSWVEIEGEKFGMKINLSDTEAKPVETNEPVPLDTEVTYDCKPWNTVDGSVFEVPTDILFTDYSDVIKKGMEYGQVYDTAEVPNACASCDSLPAAEKKQCRALMSCE